MKQGNILCGLQNTSMPCAFDYTYKIILDSTMNNNLYYYFSIEPTYTIYA